MNEKFNKNVKVEQLTNMFLSRGEESGLIVKDPLCKIVVSAPILQNFAQKWERMLSCLASFNIYKKFLIDTYHFHDDQCLGRTCARASNLARF